MNVNDILAIPLNLPRFEPDDWSVFWKIWEEDKREYKRLHPDSAGNNSPIPSWNGFAWNFNPEHRVTMFDILSKDYSEVFPNLYDRLLKSFPFDIEAILFQSNRKAITLHKDGNMFTDKLPYPASVRILLHDPNPEPNFYFVNPYNNTAKFLNLPEDTNTFVFNNPKILHGASYSGKEKILMHIICKNINEPVWFKLLQDSYYLYKDVFSIVKNG